MVLKKQRLSNVRIAEQLGVTEGAIRYQLKKAKNKKADGRKNRPSKVSVFYQQIENWINSNLDHPQTIKELYRMLKKFHDFSLSYDALKAYVYKHFPEYKKSGTRIRIENPPGKLFQVDWKESIKVQMEEEGNWVSLNFFIMTLTFSRKSAVLVSHKKDLSSFITCHQESFRRFNGVAEWLRPDCLKSAIIKWKGEKSIINETYKKYIKDYGINVFPARPGTATDKGKVEKKIRDIFRRLNIKNKVYENIEELQNMIDLKLSELEDEWICPTTGLTISSSFCYEQSYLTPLPLYLPQIPLKEKRAVVRKDGTINFLNRSFQLPERYIRKKVLCSFTGQKIFIYFDGQLIESYPYLPGANGMLMLSEKAICTTKRPISDRVRNWALEVANNQVKYYEEIIQGG